MSPGARRVEVLGLAVLHPSSTQLYTSYIVCVVAALPYRHAWLVHLTPADHSTISITLWKKKTTSSHVQPGDFNTAALPKDEMSARPATTCRDQPTLSLPKDEMLCCEACDTLPGSTDTFLPTVVIKC